jgi:rhodanese-related sulfurtransferase
VRTEEEFGAQRINGAILIPDYEITNLAESELPDKNAVILVFDTVSG